MIRPVPFSLCLAALVALAAALPLRADPPAAGAEILTSAGADHFHPFSNPWVGFNKDSVMSGQVERNIIVDDTGRLTTTPFPVSIDVADFQGKGIPDILMVDGDGYVRYFPNSGTKEAPKFTEGMVLPVLLGVSPFQLQAVDFDGDGKPDLVLGDDDGNFYMLRNQGGNGTIPRFENPKKLEQARVDITEKGQPWCNFVSPAYATWRPGASAMDLILGDGTYASDNIYYLRNKGSTERPKFEPKVLLITGDGRQHLTVRACHWSSADKPDLLVGERNGSVTLYANDTTESDPVPKFKPGKLILVGGNPKFAPFGRIAEGDLNGDGKPDILWSDALGAVWYSLNTGTAAEPVFGPGVALKCPTPPKLYAVPNGWTFRGNGGVLNSPLAGGFFYFLHTVSANSQEPSTFEQGFEMPPGSPGKYAMKFEFMPQPEQITSPYPPYLDKDGNDGVFILFYSSNGYSNTQVPLKEKTPYKVSFQIKGDGLSKFEVALIGTERVTEKQGGRETYTWKPIGFEQDVSVSSSWRPFEYTHTFHFDKDADEAGKNIPANFTLCFRFSGKGTFYLTDVSIKPMTK